jgi:hypothetical protein
MSASTSQTKDSRFITPTPLEGREGGNDLATKKRKKRKKKDSVAIGGRSSRISGVLSLILRLLRFLAAIPPCEQAARNQLRFLFWSLKRLGRTEFARASLAWEDWIAVKKHSRAGRHPARFSRPSARIARFSASDECVARGRKVMHNWKVRQTSPSKEFPRCRIQP